MEITAGVGAGRVAIRLRADARNDAASAMIAVRAARLDLIVLDVGSNTPDVSTSE